MLTFMRLVSFIGSSGFIVPVLLVVFWCLNPRAGARAAIVLALSGTINAMLKPAWHAPRPYWTDPSLGVGESRASFGMPSGHAQGSAVAWGMVGVHAGRRAVWAVVIVVIGLVGVSRVYLGVHSVGQVLAGYGVGAGLLVAALLLEPVVVPWWMRRGLAVRLVLSALIAAVLLTAGVLAVDSLRHWRMPVRWSRAIVAAGGMPSPVTWADGVATTGMLLGVLAGLSWLAHRGWFAADGSAARRLARLPAGLLGIAVIWSVGLLAGSGGVTVFAISTLQGLWVTAGAPELFIRMGLARRWTPPPATAGGCVTETPRPAP